MTTAEQVDRRVTNLEQTVSEVLPVMLERLEQIGITQRRSIASLERTAKILDKIEARMNR